MEISVQIIILRLNKVNDLYFYLFFSNNYFLMIISFLISLKISFCLYINMPPEKRIELLVPAGSFPNLKAAVSRKADAVYLGMNRFSARNYATNFNEKYLREAVNICHSNNVKLYLTMNTLIKNSEIKDFFRQLSFAYSAGIDAVIIQEISFLELIKQNYPGLKVHISTQAGVMNSNQANLLVEADRINLARELTKDEIKEIRKNFTKELEIFIHGALCVSVSGSCLFSSFLGGRSGNRGRCAQPCRKKYNNCFYLSTKDLCLLEKIPEIISLGVEGIKIEGRMRTPHYVAVTTDVYRKAIDNYSSGKSNVTAEMKKRLREAFNRDFTSGWFDGGKDMFNRASSSGASNIKEKEEYKVSSGQITGSKLISVNKSPVNRRNISAQLPLLPKKECSSKLLAVRVYTYNDALLAARAGADIIYYDLFSPDFNELKGKLTGEKEKVKLFAFTPRIMLDKDLPLIVEKINELKPAGILAGNYGMLSCQLDLPIHLDYNANAFNDFDVDYYLNKKAVPILSPELSITEMKQFCNKNFFVLVHGKIRLMTLRHELEEGWIKDQIGATFKVNKIHHGGEILNGKELGLLGKSSALVHLGIKWFYVDTESNSNINISTIVSVYRNILDGKTVDDSKLKKKYVLGWSYKGVE